MMKVRDVMTKQVSCCTPEATLEMAARVMAVCDCGSVPVVHGVDRIPIGMITDRDIVVRALAEGEGSDLTVGDCMTYPAITVPEDMRLDECIELLERAQIRRAIVVDGEGRCCGIVAAADIASHTSKRKAGELIQYVSQPSEAAFARS
jgi:CBS domain-containing protein